MFPKSISRQFSVSSWIKSFTTNLNKFFKSIKVFTKWKCFMVRLWKIMFDLGLTMSVGILIRLGGAVMKNRLCKKNKIQKLVRADKKSYCRHATFVSSDKLLIFLKGHFFVQRILPFLICFCFVCLPVRHTLFTLFNGPMFKLFRNSESLEKNNGKKWSQIWTFLLKKWCKIAAAREFLLNFFSFDHSV